MNEQYINGFYGKNVSCKVYYKQGFLDYEVSKLDNIKEQKLYFKNCDDYIRSFIEHIKDNVIKKLKNLNSLEINLAIFDENNILHRFIIKISNMIQDLLKYKEKICFKKSVFVIVTYENNIVFTGNISFKGLC